MSRPTPRFGRRAFLAWSGAAAVGCWQGVAHAYAPDVPVSLQVDLLNRVVPYDRAAMRRVHDGVLRVLVAVNEAEVDSRRVGSQLKDALSRLTTLGGHRVGHRAHAYTTPHTLAAACRSGVGIVYLTPGIDCVAATAALGGLDVMTVSTNGDDVARGAVLGFRLRSGRPRLLVSLTAARRHHVDFRADFLRMAEVIR